MEQITYNVKVALYDLRLHRHDVILKFKYVLDHVYDLNEAIATDLSCMRSFKDVDNKIIVFGDTIVKAEILEVKEHVPA